MHPEITLAVNAGGSGQLAQQILGGATVDLFLPATDDWIAKLTEQNKVARHKLLLRNRLALAWRSDYAAAVPLDKLAEVSGPRLAIGHPESVPVGKYARQAMKKLGVWDKISSDLILANDVREVLAYIERGDVDAGFVYVTDIAGKPGARYELVPAELTDPIRYPAILIGETPSEAATAFYEFLSEPAAQEAFKSAGFEIEP
jgi:molybdate transport system substrate-binding protein